MSSSGSDPPERRHHKISKDSRKIIKKKVEEPVTLQVRHPTMITQILEQRVIHTDAANFAAIVQRLTGMPQPKQPRPSSPSNNVSDPSNSSSDSPGILSPSPDSLPPISRNEFTLPANPRNDELDLPPPTLPLPPLEDLANYDYDLGQESLNRPVFSSNPPINYDDISIPFPNLNYNVGSSSSYLNMRPPLQDISNYDYGLNRESLNRPIFCNNPRTNYNDISLPFPDFNNNVGSSSSNFNMHQPLQHISNYDHHFNQQSINLPNFCNNPPTNYNHISLPFPDFNTNVGSSSSNFNIPPPLQNLANYDYDLNIESLSCPIFHRNSRTNRDDSSIPFLNPNSNVGSSSSNFQMPRPPPSYYPYYPPKFP